MSLVSLFRKTNRKSLFTTPSHSGKIFMMHKFYQWYKCDISEVDTYNPQEELKKSQERAAKIYGVKSTHYLTNGSTSGVIAATLASVKPNEKLMLWSKSHPSHKSAAKLAHANTIEYELKYNNEWGIYEPLTPDELEELLIKHSPKAIIITTPTYEGLASDVEEISKICKKYNVIFIADEAHGALYPFSEKLPQSAIKYADYTIQSLHKTAGGLNPTALLHTNCDKSPEEALSLITTTSPSYPMLATIEANINFLASKRGKKTIEELISNIEEVKSKLTNLKFFGDDITKINIKKQGLSGFELSEKLFKKYSIEDEKTNEKSTMLLCGIGTTKEKLARLLKLRKV